MFYNIPDDSKKLGRMSQHCKSSQAESVTPTRHETHVARQSVDLTGVLSCRATLIECLRHNLVSLRQVSGM